MTEPYILLQSVTTERTAAPSGFRVWSDGNVQRTADNPIPSPTERLDKDRELNWQDSGRLAPEQVEQLKTAILENGIIDLPPSLTINYCKEDPPTAIWTINVDGRIARIVVWDPRPRRSAEFDRLSAVVAELLPT
jgi:hypothetical protein